jgi:hypothetical protein
MDNNNQTTDFKFLTIGDFKKKLNIDTINVVKNPHTGKLFVEAGGANYKCQLDINLTNKEDLRFLVKDGVISDACLVDVTNAGANVVATL